MSTQSTEEVSKLGQATFPVHLWLQGASIEAHNHCHFCGSMLVVWPKEVLPLVSCSFLDCGQWSGNETSHTPIHVAFCYFLSLSFHLFSSYLLSSHLLSSHLLSSHLLSFYLLLLPLAAGGGGPHPHRVVSGGDGGRTVLADNDENKYRRKNPMEMVSRWFK